MNAFKKAVFAATIAIAGFSTSAAHAALINGDEITLASGSSSAAVAITNGVEFSNIADYLSFDFSATQLLVTISKSLPNKFVFASNLSSFVFSGFDDAISGFTLTSNAPQFKNFDTNNFSLNINNSITLNFAGVAPANDNAQLIFSIITKPTTPAPGNAIPEPASAALLGLGLLAFAGARRKFAKK